MTVRPLAFLVLVLGAGSCALMGSFDGDYELTGTSAPALDDDGDGGETGTEGGGGATGPGGSAGGQPLGCEEACPTGRCVDDLCVPWVDTFSSSGFIRAVSVGTSGMGDVVVGGDFELNALVGMQTLSSQGMNDVFIARYARHGEPKWVKSFGGVDFDELGGMAVDDDGDTYVAMRCNHMSLSGLGTIGTGGGDDICLLRLGPSGDAVWARSFGQWGWEAPLDVAVSAEGVFVVGRYDGNVDFDGFTLAGGTQSGFVIGVDKIDGSVSWAVDVPSPTYAEASAVAAKGDKVFVGGRFGSWTDIQGYMLSDDDGTEDLFVASFNAKSGTAHWVKRLHNLPGGGWAELRDIAVVGPDAIIAGSFQGPWNFDGPPVTSFNPQGYVARIGGPMGRVWFHATTGTSFAEMTGVATNDMGDVVVTGAMDGASSFGPHPLTVDTNTFGAFIGHVGPSGDVLGAESLEGAGAEYATAPHIHANDGNLLFVGDFDGTLQVGDEQHVANGWEAYLVSHGAF